MLRSLYIVLHQVGLRPRAFILLGVPVDASQPCRLPASEPPHRDVHFCRDQWPAASCADAVQGGAGGPRRRSGLVKILSI